MRITLEGYNENGNKEKIIYNLFDEFSQKTKISSMARTTGYTATAAINLFLDGVFEEKGVFPPELIGRHRSCFNYFMSYLKERDINYEKEVISIS